MNEIPEWRGRHILTVATRQVGDQPLWQIAVVATSMEMLKPDKFLKITKTGTGPCVLNNHQMVKTNTQHKSTSLGLLVWMRGKNSDMVKT